MQNEKESKERLLSDPGREKNGIHSLVESKNSDTKISKTHLPNKTK